MGVNQWRLFNCLDSIRWSSYWIPVQRSRIWWRGVCCIRKRKWHEPNSWRQMHAKILWSAETSCAIRRKAASAVLLARILRRIPLHVSINRALFYTKPRKTRLDSRGRKSCHPITGLLVGVLVSHLPQHKLPDADPHPQPFALQTLLDPLSS